MRAQSAKERVQGVRRGGHLPARSDKEPMQGVRRGEHLPARSEKERVQGVRRGEHLPAQSDTEYVQDVQSRQGRLDAAGPRGALNVTHTNISRANMTSGPHFLFVLIAGPVAFFEKEQLSPGVLIEFGLY